MKTICEAEYMITKLNFPRSKKCTNKAVCEREGISYCGIHDPERKKIREEKNDLKKEETRNKKASLNFAYLSLKSRKSQLGG